MSNIKDVTGITNRRIGVTFGLTKNLGSYESARFDFMEEADIPDGADIKEAYKLLLDDLDDQMALAVKDVVEGRD